MWGGNRFQIEGKTNSEFKLAQLIAKANERKAAVAGYRELPITETQLGVHARRLGTAPDSNDDDDDWEEDRDSDDQW
jgi:hypothetical protein